jgi:hypothetical protein
MITDILRGLYLSERDGGRKTGEGWVSVSIPAREETMTEAPWPLPPDIELAVDELERMIQTREQMLPPARYVATKAVYRRQIAALELAVEVLRGTGSGLLGQ